MNCLYVARFTIIPSKTQMKFPLSLKMLDFRTKIIIIIIIIIIITIIIVTYH